VYDTHPLESSYSPQMQNKSTMHVAVWVHNDAITIAQFKSRAPSITRFFVCRQDVGRELYCALKESRQIQEQYANGFRFKGDLHVEAPGIHTCMGVAPHQLDGVKYEIWGPGTKYFVRNLAENIDIIDENIRRAVRYSWVAENIDIIDENIRRAVRNSFGKGVESDGLI
jgi:hypothetical protein